ncbi:MAG: hypothetical protein ACOX6U_09185 [Oscillospiraceae bacterium]|jgi:hypothetical protein
MELIDKAAVVSVIVNTPTKNQHTDVLSALALRTIEILNIIEKFPSIDAVTVVRCKNCKYWDDGRCEGIENGLIREYTKPYDFCSYGEWRD